MPGGVTVAPETLNLCVLVQIQAGQLSRDYGKADDPLPMAAPRTNIIWKLTKDQLQEAAAQSRNMSEMLSPFGLKPVGGYYRAMWERIKTEGIDTSHFETHSDGSARRAEPFARPLEEVMIEDSDYHRGALKRRLIRTGVLKNKCDECGQLPMWNGKKLVMQLDHKNGKKNDHRRENIRLLCPNCHSQTPTFSGRNCN